MPILGKRSIANLNSAHADLQAIVSKAVNVCDFTVICGHRNKIGQDAAFAAGNSKTPWPKSKHNSIPSMAVDIVPFDSKTGRALVGIDADFKALSAAYGKSEAWARAEVTRRYDRMTGAMLGAASALGIGLRWGGDWDQDTDTNDQTFADLPHFELTQP